jgi:hypothetical protein
MDTLITIIYFIGWAAGARWIARRYREYLESFSDRNPEDGFSSTALGLAFGWAWPVILLVLAFERFAFADLYLKKRRSINRARRDANVAKIERELGFTEGKDAN